MAQLAAGSAGVGVVVVIVVNALKARSYIGSLEDDVNDSEIKANSVNVSADAEGTSYALGAGLSAGGVAVNGAVVLAFNTIENIAAISRKNVHAGAINVTSTLTGNTEVLIPSLTAGGIAVGACVGYTNSNSQNLAFIQLDGANVTADGDVTVEAGKSEPNYSRALTTVITGVVGYVSAAINIAIARNSGVNSALITGTANGGKLTASNLEIKALGNGTAYAVIASAALGKYVVNASVAYAWLSNKQHAGADTQGDVEARSISVESDQRLKELNKSTNVEVYIGGDKNNKVTLPIKFDSMAKAYIFAAGIGKFAAVASGAFAVTNSTSEAKFKAGTVTVGKENSTATNNGDVDIKNFAESTANAQVGNLSAGVVAVTLLVAYSYAKGTYNAYADINGGTILGHLNIENTYDTVSKGYINPAEGGFSVAGVAGKVNAIGAISSTQSSAHMINSADLTVGNNVTVHNTGYVITDAFVKSAALSVSVVEINANVLLADSKIKQDAYIKNYANMTVLNGDVDVASVIANDKEGDDKVYGKTSTEIGGMKTDAKLRLLGADINIIEATSETTNNAYIEGRGTNMMTVTGDVNVNADTKTKVVAESNTGNTIGGLVLGAVYAYSRTADQVYAYINKADMTLLSYDGVYGGSLNVTATSNADSLSKVESGATVSVVSGTAIDAKAQIGDHHEDENKNDILKKQTVEAKVNSSDIIADRDIKVIADNTGNARSIVLKELTVGLDTVDVVYLPTESNYRTHAESVASVLKTLKGSVIVKAKDQNNAESVAESSSIGIGLNAKFTYGENTVNTDTDVNVTGTIDAYNGIDVIAESNATMNAVTVANDGGFATGDYLKAYNTLNRKVQTIIDSAKLETDFGDISIKAEAGNYDDITTKSEISAGGVIALSHASAYTNITSNAIVLINSNTVTNNIGFTEIRDRFGTIKINALSGMKYVENYAYVEASGLGNEPNAYAELTVDSADTCVNIGKIDGTHVNIEGKYVYILAKIDKLYLDNYSDSTGNALGTNIDAESAFKNSCLMTKVDVDNLTLIGHDIADIRSSANPVYNRDYDGLNIYAYARVQLNAVGDAYANTSGNIYTQANTNVGSHFTYRGANLTIDAEKFDSYKYSFVTRKGGFIYKHESNGATLTDDRLIYVASDSTYYLGDAAGGIYIDIYEGSDGKVYLREVGVGNPTGYYTPGDTIQFRTISNNKPGYLTIKANKIVTLLKVYDQAVIPGIFVTNRTNSSLNMGNMFVMNGGFINPILSGCSATITRNNLYPVISIVNTSNDVSDPDKDGSVTVNGFIANMTGKVAIEWNGDVRGELFAYNLANNISAGEEVNPIWAHELVIKNAKKIGRIVKDGDKDKREDVKATIFAAKAEDPLKPNNGIVTVNADGDIYLTLQAASLHVFKLNDKREWVPVLPEYNESMLIDNITSEDGIVDIVLQEAVVVDYLDGSDTVIMPIPGTLSYMAKEIDLTDDTSLKGFDVLQRYCIGYDIGRNLYIYELPNKTVFYMDKDGNVASIQEADMEMNVGDMVFEKENGKVKTVKLAEGISINLLDGTLNVADEVSFEVLLTSVIGSWLNGKLTGNDKPYKVIVTKPESSTSNRMVDVEVSLQVMYTESLGNGKQRIYYAVGKKPVFEEITNSNKDLDYIIVYDTDTDSVELYGLKLTKPTSYSVSDELDGGHLPNDGSKTGIYYKTDMDWNKARIWFDTSPHHELEKVKITIDPTKKDFIYDRFNGNDNLRAVVRVNTDGSIKSMVIQDVLKRDNEGQVLWSTPRTTLNKDSFVEVGDMHYMLTAAAKKNLPELANVFFKFTYDDKGTLSSFKAEDTTYTATNGIFYFAELVHYKGWSTEVFARDQFELRNYTLTIQLAQMLPVDASLVEEDYVIETTFLHSDNEMIYVDDKGIMYAYDEAGNKVNLRFEAEIANDGPKKYYLLDSSDKRVKIDGVEAWFYHNADPKTPDYNLKEVVEVNGVKYYKLDSHRNTDLLISFTESNGSVTSWKISNMRSDYVEPNLNPASCEYVQVWTGDYMIRYEIPGVGVYNEVKYSQIKNQDTYEFTAGDNGNKFRYKKTNTVNAYGINDYDIELYHPKTKDTDAYWSLVRTATINKIFKNTAYKYINETSYVTKEENGKIYVQDNTGAWIDTSTRDAEEPPANLKKIVVHLVIMMRPLRSEQNRICYYM